MASVRNSEVLSECATQFTLTPTLLSTPLVSTPLVSTPHTHTHLRVVEQNGCTPLRVDRLIVPAGVASARWTESVNLLLSHTPRVS